MRFREVKLVNVEFWNSSFLPFITKIFKKLLVWETFFLDCKKSFIKRNGRIEKQFIVNFNFDRMHQEKIGGFTAPYF